MADKPGNRIKTVSTVATIRLRSQPSALLDYLVPGNAIVFPDGLINGDGMRDYSLNVATLRTRHASEQKYTGQQ